MASNILVIQTAFLGDVLLSIPLLKNARRLGPNVRLTLLCREGFSDFFLRSKLADEVIEVKKNENKTYQLAFEKLKSTKFDIIFSPHQSVRSALLAHKLQAAKKIGFHRWWNGYCFNERVKRPMHLPDALRQLSLIRSLNSEIYHGFSELDNLISKNPNALTRLRPNEARFSIPEWATMAVDFGGKPQSENTVFMAPGSVWATKKWTFEGYRDLARELSKMDYQIVFVGSPEEREECSRLAKEVPGAKSIAGVPSLFGLCSHFQTGRLLVTNDNGAMHLGSVAGIPTVAIFGPTTLSLGYRPWNNKALVVEDHALSCRPCGVHGHNKCPIGTHVCMKNIKVAEVLRATQALLK